jgi:outer membrane protein TolC
MIGLRGCFRHAAKATGGAGLLLLTGCAVFVLAAVLEAAPVPNGASQPGYLPSGSQPAPLAQGILLPPTTEPPAGPMDQGKALPISLDTVFRLASDQNGKIAIAREQLNEAFAAKDLADKSWIPDLFVGTTYLRHEGGIQDFQGFLVHSSYGAFFVGPTIQGTLDLREFAFKKIDAERKIWQQRGEVAKLTSENLLDAASTYIDLLAARTGELVSLKLEQEMQRLLTDTEKLAKVEFGIKGEMFRLKAELDAQKQITRKMREGSRAAAAKLTYLLGLDPEAELVPVDSRLRFFALVDDSVPARQLVDLALSQGPGIQEMSGLLALIDDASAKAQGLGRFIPIVKMCVSEGALGAGPGSSTTWDNAFNACFSVGWNLNDLCTSHERRRLAESKKLQAQLGFQELTAKLTLGVEEALEASRSGSEQINLGRTQVKEAEKSYEFSHKRWKYKVGLGKDSKGIPASPGEVLMGLAGVGRAEFNLINAVREHDKAQLRLFVLTGQVDQYACKE